MSINTMSQCLDFAKKTASSQMSPYVADGNYNACDMREGETAEMYKTFFEGQSYRLIVAKAPNLPPVYIRVVDKNGAVLFDNQKMNYTHSWDFKVQSTQMLVVQIKVLDQKKATKEHGCVGILFGMETSKKK
ncbi:hypothetical protein LX69_00326 [Breznakibacter xylanolyticus]|uniref:Uncharacterized protein n=2 Tax=Breznakibacter xylanolyticus TaxID=990 RepID=A0A2W7QEJ0_9BACT|nr:hypothetical protein LX69_00326 [Breznakibacter xylanolyticus]